MDRERTPSRLNVLGVGVSAIDMSDALAAIARWIDAGGSHYVCVTGVHGVMECHRDDALRSVHNAADLVTPDGMPLVWLGRLSGHQRMRRVYGPDLLLACCASELMRGRRHFFTGSTPDVLDHLGDRLQASFPALNICGTHAPPFRALSASEDDAMVHSINAAAPDIVWVGLGTPKQERWMAEHLGRIQAPVMIGIGAAFDFVAGTKRQAPEWMQQSGLEWAFRLLSEPRRLTARYLLNNPAFLWLALLQALHLRQFELESRP